MKSRILWCGVVLWMAGALAAQSSCQIARIYCRESEAIVYMTDDLAAWCMRTGCALSPHKVRGFGPTYICAESPQVLRARVLESQAVLLELPDRSWFFIPMPLVEKLECRVPASAPLHARTVRHFILFWSPLLERLATAPEAEHEQVVAEYVSNYGLIGSSLHSLREIGRTLGVNERYDALLAPCDTAPAEPAPESVVSSESGSSGVSFVTITDHTGARVKRRDIAWLLCHEGADRIRGRYADHVLDLEAVGLHSIHDIYLLVSLLGSEQCAAVRTLKLGNNSITQLPSRAFACFPRVQTVMLVGNPLAEIADDAFVGIDELHTLDMSRCGITEIPAAAVGGLGNLERLILRDNRLTKIPSLSGCPQLRLLDAPHNMLIDLPDMSACVHLEALDVSHNLLARCPEYFLPAADHSSLLLIAMNDNNIATVSPGFMRRLPAQGVTNLQGNPMWADAGQITVITESHGYEQIAAGDVEMGRALSQQIRNAMFADMRHKLCSYLLSRGLVAQSVIRDEIIRERPVSRISTTATDIGMLMYRYGYWVVLGGTILGSVVGGGGMLLLKWGTKKAMSWAFGGGTVGGVIGAAASYAGIVYAYDGGKQFYLNSGGSERVYMSSDLRNVYVGTYRMIVLIAILKQYLIACNTALYWLLNFDELADAGDSFEAVMKHLDEIVHTHDSLLLARPTDAGCVVLVSELLGQRPLDEVLHYAPRDLFPAGSLADQPLAHNASYAFFGVEKLTLVRTAICRFASVAQTLRAMLMNRYVGTHDYHHMLAVVADLDPLRAGLETVITDVLAATEEGMSTAGHEADLLFGEVQHLHDVAHETLDYFDQLEEHAQALYAST